MTGSTVWTRISLELSHTWPGEMYLRFEAADGAATMVAVDADDLNQIAGLMTPSATGERVTVENEGGTDA